MRRAELEVAVKIGETLGEIRHTKLLTGRAHVDCEEL